MPRPPSPGKSLLRILEESATPVAALNLSRQLVFASRSLGEWLGIEPQELIGRRCDYTSGGDDPIAAAMAGLCPPPEAFSGGIDSGWVNRPAVGIRETERRPARFIRLMEYGSSEGLLLVVILPPVTNAQPEADSALSPERLHAHLHGLRGTLGRRFHISQLIGESDAIGRVREQVRVATNSQARVLVLGPPGSGRQHVARTIYYGETAESIGALVPIACPLVDAEQMQFALAGILRRQYESPTLRPPAALLLDVDRLRPEGQQELAGFLHLPQIELHTLATSRVPLSRLAAKGRFRPDLAYALSTITIALPPLGRRRNDIPLLAQHFLEELNAAGGRQLAGFQSAAMELLAGLPWPGNVDELARAVREAGERAAGPLVATADLPDWVRIAATGAALLPRKVEAIQLDHFLADIEREVLARALRAARGNRSKAAQLLGLSRPRLLRRLAQLGLIAQPAAEEPVVFEPLPEEP